MRFGRTLEQSIYPPWKEQYIEYSKLKKLLREDHSAPGSPERQTADEWTEDDESSFVEELVNNQLEKVHAFHKDTYEKLRDRTAKCESRLDDVAVGTNGTAESNEEQTQGGEEESSGEGLLSGKGSGNGNVNGNGNGKKPVPSEEEKQNTMKEVLSELDNISKETSELEKYSRINYAGFLKAAKKHDRKRGHAYRVRPLLQVRLANLPFNREDYSPLLYRLSAMYSFIRQHLDGVAPDRGLSMSEAREGKEEYVSHKFWVHPENLLEVKTMILRRLPVLVYNPQTSKIAEGSQPDPSITSIYFDNPAFSLYTKKVEEGEASSLRLRWYGQLNAKPEIWVEKKTITEAETSQESKFVTKEKYVQRFVKDDYHMEKQIKKLEDRVGADSTVAKELKSSVSEVQSFIKENNLQPVMRANYTRTAFQIPGDSRVRISLDTDLAFIREDAIDTDRPCRDPETWHRTDIDDGEMEFPFSSIRKGEISRFPFALLELKLRNSASNNGKPPEWIQELMHSHVVKEAPRFSKFVHGVANLFEDYVNTFPFWLSEMEVDIRRDPQKAFEEEQAKKQKERDDEFAVGSLLKTGSHMQRHQSAVLSPVGSPTLGSSTKKSAKGANGKRSELSTSVNATATATADQTQQDEVVEVPDEDETGYHGHHAERNRQAKFTDLIPGFSTSKYAQAKRDKVNLPPGVSKPEHWIKDQGAVKVEAKVWLANQRTFIKWQHVSILLASLGVGLYNAAGEHNDVARALALVYTLVAVFTAAWGYGIYMWRTNLIQKRSGKDFDAVTGPVVVCVGLIVALVLNFVFKYKAALREREEGHYVETFNRTEYLGSHWSDL